MASDRAMFKVDYEDIWGEVEQRDFGETKPSNEHDRHTVQGLTDIMKAYRRAISQSKQARANKQTARLYERRMQVMRSSWVRECHLASKVDSEVPMVQKDELGIWRIYTQGN